MTIMLVGNNPRLSRIVAKFGWITMVRNSRGTTMLKNTHTRKEDGIYDDKQNIL